MKLHARRTRWFLPRVSFDSPNHQIRNYPSGGPQRPQRVKWEVPKKQ